MTEAALERPSWRVSFRWVVAVALGLAAVGFVAGRHIYESYGGYRPLALMHVPPSMRYRARVELSDVKRVPALAPLLRAADPRGVRLPALRKKLTGAALHEVAFGAGPARGSTGTAGASDFVVVLGLQLQAETGLPLPAQSLCEVLSDDGIHSKPTSLGCVLEDGTLIASSPEGAIVVASRAELVEGLLERPEIGDRLGFSGPSVRGTAPEPVELTREAAALARAIATKYP
ncbi:MAG TPA: hypothetical protein VIW29_10420 [Polyangiaceae bacterium]